jgi:PEP-CTERM motif-containing protein
VQTGFTGTDDFSLLQSGNNEYLVLNNNVAAAVPEPSTYAMMLAGFGVLYCAARRRRGAKFA